MTTARPSFVLLQVAPNGLQSGDIVELYGPSGSAKSELLLNMAMFYALPTDLTGRGHFAIYIDLGEYRLGRKAQFPVIRQARVHVLHPTVSKYCSPCRHMQASLAYVGYR